MDNKLEELKSDLINIYIYNFCNRYEYTNRVELLYLYITLKKYINNLYTKDELDESINIKKCEQLIQFLKSILSNEEEKINDIIKKIVVDLNEYHSNQATTVKYAFEIDCDYESFENVLLSLLEKYSI